MNSSRPVLGLAFVSAVILALELACIRWFPAHVLYLTFFTNGVLLASFIGMSIGCLLARRPNDLIRWTPFWLVVALGAGLLAELFRSRIEYYVDVGRQENPQVVFYGTEAYSQHKLLYSLPAEWLFGLYFLLIAAVHIGPGQELGRAFNRVPNRLSAYAANLLGSLAGIGIFAIASWCHLSPVVWFGAIIIGLVVLIRRVTLWPALMLAIAFVLTIPTSGLIPAEWYGGKAGEQQWSPYYRIKFETKSQTLITNQIGHQIIQSVKEKADEPYALPYLFQRDLKSWPTFKRVLIIGAGTGNDVARACQWLGPDAKIDAVEIDPVIQQMGARLHTDHPSDDPRVTRILGDGRAILRRAPDAEYDLVVFALIDSLVLSSGYSNLRLESYLYTDESFRDVRRVLKPDGVCTVYNFFRRTFVTRRLFDSLGKAFGSNPILITNPPVDRLFAEGEDAGISTMIVGSPSVVQPLQRRFSEAGGTYWFLNGAIGTDSKSQFGQSDKPPGERGDWLDFRPTAIDSFDVAPATDDWPFLYSRHPAIPNHNVTGMFVMILMSLILYVLAERYAGRLDQVGQPPIHWQPLARSFFLGAGFMLIETKAVVALSLLFGSTWTVNTVVFSAVLIMSLIGSVYAAIAKPKNLTVYYGLLFASLVVSMLVPANAFLGQPEIVRTILSCVLAFLPITFAGIIFAVTFAKSNEPDRVFGANIAGALIGGLAENASMLLGFRWLGLVAIALYAGSAWWGREKGK